MDYTRRDLAQAVLDAHPDSKRGLDLFRGGFSDAMKAHQERVRDGLLKAFGVDLEAEPVLAFMLGKTARTNAVITSPGDGFGEAGLLVQRLEHTGVLSRIGDIRKLNEQSREAHLDIADELIGLMGPTVDTVTSADLLALGVDDTPPNSSDYEIDY